MKYLPILGYISLIFFSCNQTNDIVPETPEACPEAFQTHQAHPKAAIYQEILDRNRKKKIVGATMLIKDADGIWSGASGTADLSSHQAIRPCDRMAIASISKPFTATVIMKLIDEGLLSLESKVKDYIDPKIVKKIDNAAEATISHLLSHQSGIADYYNLQFLLDQVNTDDRNETFEDLLSYIYGKKAYFEAGTSYAYSNINFVLLGMIAEKVSLKPLKQLYQEIIFDPLQLKSAYFDMQIPFPDDMPKGYVDLYGNDDMVDAKFLYGDEGRTPDGGIVINNLDLFHFFQSLWKGEIVSQARVDEMTNWFELPEDWKDYEVFGQLKNGFGLEHFENQHAWALGHTGGIDGFLSYAFYFPEQDYFVSLVVNTADYDLQGRIDIYREVVEVMFE